MFPKLRTTADARQLHSELTRYLFTHFRRKLTIDELHEAASEALIEADRAIQAGNDIAQLDRWLRRAGWRNALEMIRKIEGEGKVPRQRPTTIDHMAGGLADPEDRHAEVAEEAATSADARELLNAFDVLRPEEQRVLHLRFFDELEVDQILGIVGCSRHQYENLHKRAIKKLREALVKGAGDSSCGDYRMLILQGIDTAHSASWSLAAQRRSRHADRRHHPPRRRPAHHRHRGARVPAPRHRRPRPCRPPEDGRLRQQGLALHRRPDVSGEPPRQPRPADDPPRRSASPPAPPPTWSATSWHSASYGPIACRLVNGPTA